MNPDSGKYGPRGIGGPLRLWRLGTGSFRAGLAPLLLSLTISLIGASSSAQIVVPTVTISGETPHIPWRSLSWCVAVTGLGDLGADGSTEIAIGCGPARLLLLRMRDLGRVERVDHVVTGCGRDPERFPITGLGASVANIGDITGDDTPDLAVGAIPVRLDDCLTTADSVKDGAVFILFLNEDLTFQKTPPAIGYGTKGITGESPDSVWFGWAVTGLGDIDGDTIPDIMVGAPGRTRKHKGNAYAIRLNRDGSVRGVIGTGIASEAGGFPSDQLPEGARFGEAVTNLGDLDGDGVSDVAIGAPGMGPAGSIWLIFLNPDGSAKDGWIEIAQGKDGFEGELEPGDGFGSALLATGDADSNGVVDLLVGAPGDNDGGPDRGAVWRLFLESDGSVGGFQKISHETDGIRGLLTDRARFGSALGDVGDLDGDSRPDLAVAAPGDYVIWMLSGLPAPLTSTANIVITPVTPAVDDEIRIAGDWGTGMSNVEISCRTAGAPQFLAQRMQYDAGSRLHEGTIPSYCAGQAGTEFYVEMESRDGAQTRLPPGDDVISVRLYDRDGVILPVEAGNLPDEYRLIAVPLELESPDALDILEPFLGSYAPENWRFFRRDGETGYVELSNARIELQPGVGYWLLSRTPAQVETGPGHTIATNPEFPIPLHEGWNFIGNPFLFDVPLHNLSLNDPDATVDILAYAGEWRVPDALAPFEGYIVWGSTGDDTLSINGVLAPAVGKRADSTEPDWSIQVSARSGLVLDALNEAVVVEGADVGRDAFDRAEPPVIGDYVRVYFEGVDWSGTVPGSRVDARSPSAVGHEWRIAIETASPGNVDVDFIGVESVQLNFDAVLVDEVLRVKQDLRSDPRYRIFVPAGTKRLLRLVAGSSQFTAAAARGLPDVTTRDNGLEVFPVPSSGPVVVRFDLAREEQVVLRVFDALGRVVETLIDGEVRSRGWNEVVWHGETPSGSRAPPGQYFIRMTTPAVCHDAIAILGRDLTPGGHP